MTTCAIYDCSSPVRTQGWCHAHYTRWRRYGDPFGKLPASLAERLWRRIERSPSGCWQWTGNINPYGYGSLSVDGAMKSAHRTIYRVIVGPIPDGLQLDHLCRNRACVNPLHLEPVTLKTNVYRGVSFAAVNAVKTHCPQDHPYDAENTHIYQGRRYCKACNREQVKKRDAKKRADS